jgi:glyoxylase-like metal-dependent hydrolase (beta-lactamase superfamily II)
MVRLHAGNPSPMTGWGNWTYFFPGRHPVMIDAGVGIDTHMTAIESASGRGPGHVLVTHAHGDHISGVRHIGERWPHTQFSKMPWRKRDAEYPVTWQPLQDGDVVPAGDRELHVVHTPGHAPDHVAFWDPSTRVLYSGDLVVSGTTVVIPASMEGSLSLYLRSLERVLELAPTRLRPAHGTEIDEPAHVIRQYIEHRRERERQIVNGLTDGYDTVDALVTHIYVGLKASLVPMAEESVRAHLRKLLDDGAVLRDGNAWRLR